MNLFALFGCPRPRVVWTLAVGAVCLFFSPGAPAVAETVTVADGQLQGVSTVDGIVSFKGIPFARPPVASLRWRAPQAPDRWSGVRTADEFGPACPQHLPPSFGPDPRQSEDCLYLNVWKPAAATPHSRLPVMVWIFGGGFNMGDAAGAGNDVSLLARDGVVAVNFNYRLGRLGWFSTSSLKRESETGEVADFGLMDQIAALRWVHDNIAAFGGDPSNVTIFGTSSGGISVELLMISPAARGLFAKAISQSGFGRLPLQPLSVAEQQGDAFAAAHGATTAEALRALPLDQVIERVPVEVESNTASTFPVLDGKLIPEQVLPAFEAGREAPVPWIVGSNSYEASLVSHMLLDPDRKIFTHIPAILRPLILSLFDLRQDGNRREIAAALTTDSLMTEPARALAEAHRKLQQPVFRYFFAYVPEARRPAETEAMHGEEVPFVFQSPHPMQGMYIPSARDRATARRIASYWVNFAKTGNPNGGGLAYWPADSHDDILLIDDSGEHAAHRFHWWQLNILLLIAYLQGTQPGVIAGVSLAAVGVLVGAVFVLARSRARNLKRERLIAERPV